jgi:RNA polymerase sigma factor (sigma-70 family)
MSPSVSARLLLTQSDARLVQLARAGHERAFEALVQRYRRPLLGYCRRLLLPNERAEDALQQGLLQAWLALRDGAEVHAVKPWLYRIVHNAALNMLRHSGYNYAELSETLSGAGASAEDLDRRIAVREALAGLAALPEMQREALLRTAVDGRSYQEAAAALGLSEGALRGLVHRARTTLRTAATALTPSPLVSLALSSGGADAPLAGRLAAMGATGGSAGLAGVMLKAGAAAVTTGVLVGGLGTLHHREHPDARQAKAAAGTNAATGAGAGAGAHELALGAQGAVAGPGPAPAARSSGPPASPHRAATVGYPGPGARRLRHLPGIGVSHGGGTGARARPVAPPSPPVLTPAPSVPSRAAVPPRSGGSATPTRDGGATQHDGAVSLNTAHSGAGEAQRTGSGDGGGGSSDGSSGGGGGSSDGSGSSGGGGRSSDGGGSSGGGSRDSSISSSGSSGSSSSSSSGSSSGGDGGNSSSSDSRRSSGNTDSIIISSGDGGRSSGVSSSGGRRSRHSASGDSPGSGQSQQDPRGSPKAGSSPTASPSRDASAWSTSR